MKRWAAVTIMFIPLVLIGNECIQYRDAMPYAYASRTKLHEGLYFYANGEILIAARFRPPNIQEIVSTIKLPDRVLDFVFYGDTVIVASDGVLFILDIADGSAMKWVGELFLDVLYNAGGKMSIEGDKLLVPLERGIAIYVIGNLPRMQLWKSYSQWDINISAAVLEEDYVYAVGYRTFLVLKMTEGQTLETVVSNPDLVTQGKDIQIQDGYAFIADDFMVVDVRDPFQPHLVKYFPLEDNQNDIRTADGYRYLLSGAFALTLDIFDVTDPGNPAHSSVDLDLVEDWYSLGSENASLSIEGDILSIQDFIYVAVYNIADRLHPVRLVLHESEDENFLDHIRMYEKGGRIAAMTLGDLRVYGVGEGGVLSLTAGASISTGWNREMVIRGDYAYISGDYNMLNIVDLGDPDAPVLVFESDDYNPYWQHTGLDVALYDHYALVLVFNNLHIGLKVWDVAIPPEAVLVKEIENLGIYPTEFEVVGRHAYMTGGDHETLGVFELSDVTEPKKVAVLEMHTENLREIGGFLYMGTHNAGGEFILGKFSVEDPLAPRLVEEIPVNVGLSDYWIGEDYAILSGAGFEILKKRHGAYMPVDSVPEYMGVSAIAVVGQHVYTAVWDSGVAHYQAPCLTESMHQKPLQAP